MSARVVVCLCCAVARSRVQLCVAVLLRAGDTAKSRDLSLSGSALPFSGGVTCIGPCGKNSHSTPPCESRARGPSLSLSLESYVCQVAPRTCVRCPRASLSEGVALRKLPVHRRWLEPLLASCLSTGACWRHATQLRNWLPQPARCLHSSTYGDHNRPAPAFHAP